MSGSLSGISDLIGARCFANTRIPYGVTAVRLSVKNRTKAVIEELDPGELYEISHKLRWRRVRSERVIRSIVQNEAA